MTERDPHSFLPTLEVGVEVSGIEEAFLTLILTDWAPVGTRRMQWVCAV